MTLKMKQRYTAIMALLMTAITSNLSAELKLIVVRHGEAQHNVDDTRNANPKHPNYVVSNLTPKGRQQAIQMAQQLEEEGIVPSSVKAVFASPLPRCLQTARILIQKLDIKEQLIIDNRITERQAGDLEGQAFYPISDRRMQEHGGETQDEVRKRVTAFYNYLTKTYKNGTVIVVTHDSNVKVLCRLITGHSCRVPTGSFREFTI